MAGKVSGRTDEEYKMLMLLKMISSYSFSYQQFDSLIQNATGFGHAEARAYQIFKGEEDISVTPKPLPCQAIDHAAGYLLAFGINAALCRTISVSIYLCLTFFPTLLVLYLFILAYFQIRREVLGRLEFLLPQLPNGFVH